MATIEFAAPAGKTFTGQEYDLDDTDTVGSSFSVSADTVPTRYRVSRSGTGIHYYVFSATNVKVAGYANLDAAIGGVCPLMESYAAAEDLAARNKDIKAKTDLIGTASATVLSPVTAGGDIPELVIGDDYKASEGRSIDVYIAKPAGVTTNQCSCLFGGHADHLGSWLVSGTVSDASGNRLRLRFELESGDTIECKPGTYERTVTLVTPNRSTYIKGETELVETQTIE